LDENFARLITTFDEVPLLSMRAKTRMLKAPVPSLARQGC